MSSNTLNANPVVIQLSIYLRVLGILLIVVGLIELVVSLTWFNSFFFGAIAAFVLGIIGIVSNNKMVVGCGAATALASIILNVILAVTAAIFYTTLQNTQACVSLNNSPPNSSAINNDLHYYGNSAYYQNAAICERKYHSAPEPESSVANPTTIGSPGAINCYCYVTMRSFSNCTVYEIPPLFYSNCDAIFGRYTENINATYGIGVVLIVLSFLFVTISCAEMFCPRCFSQRESSHQDQDNKHVQNFEQPLIYQPLQRQQSEEVTDTNKIVVHVDSGHLGP